MHIAYSQNTETSAIYKEIYLPTSSPTWDSHTNGNFTSSAWRTFVTVLLSLRAESLGRGNTRVELRPMIYTRIMTVKPWRWQFCLVFHTRHHTSLSLGKYSDKYLLYWDPSYSLIRQTSQLVFWWKWPYKHVQHMLPGCWGLDINHHLQKVTFHLNIASCL